MTITYHTEIEQNSGEWYEARRGMLTASQIKTLVTPTLKIANNGGTRELAWEMAAQRETGNIEETFQSYDMARGHVEEIYAKDLYSEHYEEITDCGFITNDMLGFLMGMSPDGLVGEVGGVEVKSRKQKFQAQIIIEDAIPKDCMLQLQASLLISQREWWDYISYSNGMPMFVKRVFPDLETHAVIKDAAIAHEKLVKENVEQYRQNIAGLAVAPRRDAETGTVMKPSGDYSHAN